MANSRRDKRPRRERPRLACWLALALAVIAGTAAMAGEVTAQNYPWCSNFADGAGTNCGFTSEQQCRLAIQGSGGYCDRNTQFRTPGAAPPAAGEERKRHVRKAS